MTLCEAGNCCKYWRGYKGSNAHQGLLKVSYRDVASVPARERRDGAGSAAWQAAGRGTTLAIICRYLTASRP